MILLLLLLLLTTAIFAFLQLFFSKSCCGSVVKLLQGSGQRGGPRGVPGAFWVEQNR